LLGFTEAPDLVTKRFNKTGHALQRGRLYSGGQLDITAVVIDGHSNVMNASNPDKKQLVGLVENHGLGQDHLLGRMPAGAEEVAAWAAEPNVTQPNRFELVKQANSSLFVIGNLTAPLGVTAQFFNLSLQPVDPPRAKSVKYGFELFPGQNSTILRQVTS
jgi:hypothetical protein